MTKEFIIDRFCGCLLGLAIGDALGAPAEGKTCFEVMNAFHTPIDMFYPYQSFPAGKFTAETLSAMTIVSPLINGKGKFDPILIKEAVDKLAAKVLYEPSMGAKTLFSKVVPIALLAAAQGIEDGEIVGLVRALALPDMKKRDVLATFMFVYVIKELIRNSEELTKPYELYDSDRSLLARLVEMCIGSEMRFPEENTQPVSEYLGFTRKKLMSPSWDYIKFVGVMGARTEIAESLSLALFAYFQAPDDFSTICKTVSLGGPASLRGAMIGALVGATIGGSLIPRDKKDQVEKGVSIETRAIEFAQACLPQEAQTIEKEDEDVDDSAV